MGKSTNRKPRPVIVAANDPTPERMRHDPSDAVDSKWEANGARIKLKVRQFRTTRVDHLYRLGALSFAHWAAANWWRARVEEGLGLPRVVGDYGQSNGVHGTCDPSPIPLSDKAERARKLLTAAKAALSLAHREAVEDSLDDPHPVIGKERASARLARWQAGLQALAVHLKFAA